MHKAEIARTLPPVHRELSAAMALTLAIGLLPALASASDEAAAWRQYARSSLQLGVDSDLAAVADQAQTGGPVSRGELAAAAGRLALSIRATSSGSSLSVGAEPGFRFHPAGPAVDFSGSRFSSSLLSPELQAQIGRGSAVTVGLTVANQRFATPGFGEVRAHSSLRIGSTLPRGTTGRAEQSFGHGVHLGLESNLGDSFVLGVNAQSRVDMDSFKTYRGIFTEPGDFDVPARGGVSLGWRAADGLTLSAGAERVLYSEVAAFTSSALPTSLLAFLGDGSSPRFAWQDLNVYSLRAELEDSSGGQWGLRMSTRQQPSPTSALLDLALRDSYRGNHFAASYHRGVGESGSFNVGASYAPAQYVLGFNPFGNRYRDGSQLEVELNWVVDF